MARCSSGFASWPGYGRLARLDPDSLRIGERVEADDYGKDDVRDFALWKGPKERRAIVDTRIGSGRPGWHIECSAMSMTHLGESFDIHTGGEDLVFPHHEDELAQSEAATGKPFVRCWLHCAHLRVGGEKMARRTRSFERVADLMDAGVSPRALRYVLISVHHRAPLNYSDESLPAATAAVERIDATPGRLAAYREERADDPGLPAALDAIRAGFEAGLDDDLNISAALASVFDGVRDLNRRLDVRASQRPTRLAPSRSSANWTRCSGSQLRPSPTSIRRSLRCSRSASTAPGGSPTAAASDRLRDLLLARGIAVEDTRDGQRWRHVATNGA